LQVFIRDLLEVDGEELGLREGDVADFLRSPPELLVAREAEGERAGGNLRLPDLAVS
jgi:hypothetical protein